MFCFFIVANLLQSFAKKHPGFHLGGFQVDGQPAQADGFVNPAAGERSSGIQCAGGVSAANIDIGRRQREGHVKRLKRAFGIVHTLASEGQTEPCLRIMPFVPDKFLQHCRGAGMIAHRLGPARFLDQARLEVLSKNNWFYYLPAHGSQQA